jgi:hypothetical protein
MVLMWMRSRSSSANTAEMPNALLPVLERVSGPDHPDTLTARHNLARWTGEAGDPAAARDQFAVLLPVRAGMRPRAPEHPDCPQPAGGLDG